MSPRLKGGLLLIVAFGLGAAAGAMGLAVYQVRTGAWGPARGARFQQYVLARLTRDLGLRPEQRQQVEAVLTETAGEFARLRVEVGPRFRAIREQSRERIRAVLTPEQQAQFDALVRRWERRAERRRGGPPAAQEDEAKGR